jgi:hypothetical protein
MLLFRSEEHVERWRRTWGQPRGASLTLAQIWGLAREWYGPDRREAGWRRKTAAEAEAAFAGLRLRGDFWKLQIAA